MPEDSVVVTGQVFKAHKLKLKKRNNWVNQSFNSIQRRGQSKRNCCRRPRHDSFVKLLHLAVRSGLTRLHTSGLMPSLGLWYHLHTISINLQLQKHSTSTKHLRVHIASYSYTSLRIARCDRHMELSWPEYLVLWLKWIEMVWGVRLAMAGLRHIRHIHLRDPVSSQMSKNVKDHSRWFKCHVYIL